MFQRKISLLFFLMMILITSGFAQPTNYTAQATSPAETEKVQREREKKALTLLEEILAESASLKLTENKCYVAFMLADMLWQKDKKRAREIFTMGITFFAQYVKELDPDAENYEQSADQIQQARQGILGQLAGRDPQIALEFLRASKLPSKDQQAEYYESLLATNLANHVAQNDPKEGLKLALAGLEKGLSANLTQTLYPLQNNDPKAAAELAQAILQKIRSVELGGNYEYCHAATSLLMFATQSQNGAYNNSNAKNISLLTQGEQKELATIILNAGLQAIAKNEPDSSNITGNVFSQIQLYEQLAPQQLATLKTKVNYVAPPPPPPGQSSEEITQFLQKASVEELVTAAQTVHKNNRPYFLENAITRAAQQGNLDLAKKIINENYPNAAERKMRLANLEQITVSIYTNQNKLNEAYQAATRMTKKQEKISALLTLVSLFSNKEDKKQAAQILDEVLQLFGTEIETREQFSQFMWIASHYFAFDMARGVSLLAPLPTRINEIVAASLVMEKFEGQLNAQRGEINFRQPDNGAALVRDYASSLGILAITDFAQGLALLDTFERSDARTLAKIIYLQNAFPR